MAHPFVDESIALLTRTPAVLDVWLRDLPEAWTAAADGWSAYDVAGHLIHGERTDWMPRLTIILEHGTAKPFEPFDREAQFAASGESLPQRLEVFRALRTENLEALRRLDLGDRELAREGLHPALGPVTARQLIATWVAHDQTHITQIARTMARRYRSEVGPWIAYLSVLK